MADRIRILMDGRQVLDSDEEYRLECEARMVADRPSTQQRADYLHEVEKARGEDAADLLRALVNRVLDARARCGRA